MCWFLWGQQARGAPCRKATQDARTAWELRHRHLDLGWPGGHREGASETPETPETPRLPERIHCYVEFTTNQFPCMSTGGVPYHQKNNNSRQEWSEDSTPLGISWNPLELEDPTLPSFRVVVSFQQHLDQEHENPSEQGRKSARLLNTSLCSLNRLLRKLQARDMFLSVRVRGIENEWNRTGAGFGDANQ